MTDEHKKEAMPQPPADYLENDQRYKDLIQEASRDYLRSEDSDFLKREGYTWDDKNNLIDKKGQIDVFPSMLVGSKGWGQVERMARDEFSERHGPDSGIYAEREKVRIYEDPDRDPAYKEVEKEILKKANSDRQSTPKLWQNLGRDDYERLAIRNEQLASEAFWGKFVSEYPEKAAAYAAKNESIAKELSRREKQKIASEQVAAESKQNQHEKDEERRREILRSLNAHQDVVEVSPNPAPESDHSNAPDSREFGDKKSIVKEQEEIYKNPWDDDPDLKSLQEEIRHETDRRLNQEPGPHENFANHYGDVSNAVRSEVWKKFVSEHPEKAQAYKEHYKEIRDILEPEKNSQAVDSPEPLPDWVREEMESRGLDPKRTFNDIDIRNPSVREAITNDPTLTAEQKENLLKTGSVKAEQSPKKEVRPEISREDIVSEYLAYQDIPASADEKKSMLDWSMKSESASRYAEALQEAMSHAPKQQIEGIASHMVSEARDILDKSGITGSSFLGSKTWAMWDIGKQYYYASHPDEADKRYTIADPLRSPEKVREIVDRHVGWEAYRTKDKKFAERFKKHPLYKKLLEYLNKPAKRNGDLSSKDLADLGAVIRKISEDNG